MGLKLRLNWYEKISEQPVGKEYSADLGDDGSIIEALGLMAESEIYDGGFDVRTDWVSRLQPFFTHKFDESIYDYQIAFRYRKSW
ncbi:colicin E3-like toxin immunity protein [Pseudomonas sp. efr-133-TYG-5]|jgi:hypothetical protein|uniref:colicin E3-like toxin immunity protein n=1 Tax=Pseudomonas sp. efr-133-TYG-5 TaxID=3040310 RepID=UPI0025533328|nr:colicin E3-like toxin immunity protein [Pseudomonas sp. efr-133-TYG-5]